MPSENEKWARVMRVIRERARRAEYRVSQHALTEMEAEDIRLDEVLEAIDAGQIIEYYPDHRRGACCLVWGQTVNGRHVHVVCTTEAPVLVIITVYEPKPPKFPNPTRRGTP
jgi:hypothetical protein